MNDDTERRPYTYEDAARVCEVSPETIRARARRGRLERGRPTNSNRPTVLLSQAEIEAIRNGRPFHPPGQPPGRPGGHPSGQSNIITALEGQIAAKDAHLEILQRQLAAVERRADRAEERAEKAEQRLIEELARLAGQNVGGLTSEPNEAETKELDVLSAELRLEFEGVGAHPPSERPTNPAKNTRTGPEPRQAEALSPAFGSNSAPVSATPATSPLPSLITRLRRGWWSQFIPPWRRTA